MSDKIRVLVKEPGKDPEVRYVEDKLENWQDIVGGYMEIVVPFDTRILCVVNEEGKLKGLEPNFGISGDYIVGTCFFVSANEDGEFTSLGDNYIEAVLEYFS